MSRQAMIEVLKEAERIWGKDRYRVCRAFGVKEAGKLKPGRIYQTTNSEFCVQEIGWERLLEKLKKMASVKTGEDRP